MVFSGKEFSICKKANKFYGINMNILFLEFPVVSYSIKLNAKIIRNFETQGENSTKLTKKPARPGSDLKGKNCRSDPIRSKFPELDRNPIRSGKNWI